MRKRLLHPALVSIIAGWAVILGAQPSGVVFASPSPSMPAFRATASDREAQIEKIVEVLSGPKAQFHLRAMGLGSTELRGRLAKLSDAQLAMMAQKVEEGMIRSV